MHFPRTIFSGVLVIAAIFLSGCMQATNHIELGPRDVVLAVGDQFTAGTGASSQFAYPEVLGKATKATVINLGQAGRGSADTMPVLRPILAKNKNIKLIILTIGFNDLLQGSDLRFLTGYLAEATQEIEKAGIPLMLVGIPGLPHHKDSKPHPVYSTLASNYPKLIWEPNALIKAMRDPENMETPSQFNADGYRVFAENIEARLKKEGFIR